MIKRYSNPEIEKIWNNKAKLSRWDKVELAVSKARVSLGLLSQNQYEQMERALGENPADEEWWLAEDARLHHDFNAYVSERRRYLPPTLEHELHKDTTTYDTEEPAFQIALLQSVEVVMLQASRFAHQVLPSLASKYRFTPMLARTHGQWAKVQSFGKRVITWTTPIAQNLKEIEFAANAIRQSKLSGAVGNFGGGLNPELERVALEILGSKPFIGATQFLPRTLFAALAQAIERLVINVDKIAMDIRLGARSGTPILQEPFRKEQTGSSAMPQKKNTIRTEQVHGLAVCAKASVKALVDACDTWEERAIEQSCVERIHWPDLFHITCQALKVMEGVLTRLTVYVDNMYKEIIQAKGTYAADEAKGWLGKKFAELGIGAEKAYRIVQLAAFNALNPSPFCLTLRANPPRSLDDAADQIDDLHQDLASNHRISGSLDRIIELGRLTVDPTLEATEDQVKDWNKLLDGIFDSEDNRAQWRAIFDLRNLLKHESYLFENAFNPPI